MALQVRYQVRYEGARGYVVIAPDGREVYASGHDRGSSRDASLFSEQCNAALMAAGK
jgi:hypothetical protein